MKNLKHFVRAIAVGLLLCGGAFSQFPTTGKTNTWTAGPVSRQHNTSTTVRVVRVARQKGFDRVVFEFEGPVPNYEIKYLRSVYYQGEGERERIKLAGSRFVQVELNQIPVEDKQIQFIEAKGFIPKGKLNLPAVAQIDDRQLFEGFYDFLIGVNGRKLFRVTELTNPSRLVIDFKY